MSELPSGDSMFKILSDVRGVQMLKILKKNKGRKEGKTEGALRISYI